MVVFTCGHCGESVQKPKVEKHYLTKCRNRNPNLSCMDCFKDFLGQDYEAHTKCITEEERYSGKGFMAKEKKGEKKQNAWVEILQSVIDEQKSAPANVLRIIETVSKHNNTPRKKPKFINFVKNVCGQKTNTRDIDQAWDLISVKLSALSNVNNQNQKNESNSSVNGQKNDNNEENDTSITMANLEIAENGNIKEENGDVTEPEKKLSKKQRKEEKKRKKYEAELQSAEAPPSEPEVEETQSSKKGKKKKDRNNSVSSNVEENGTEKSKNKKRKRQDTVNGGHEIQETVQEVEQSVQEPVKEPLSKEQKKKLKIATEEEGVCLHDQNVANTEDAEASNGKFNWHATIISVLQKKGDEIPFKRLQKKVLSEYAEMTGQDIDDRIAEKFIKKLKSAPNVRVDKNRVILIE